MDTGHCCFSQNWITLDHLKGNKLAALNRNLIPNSEHFKAFLKNQKYIESSRNMPN